MNDKALALAKALIRNFDEAETEHINRPPLYDTTRARLAKDTVATKLGASIYTVAPGKLQCPYHLHHAQEEMYVILEGHGTLRLAGELLPIKDGDVIFLPPGPEYPHQLQNTSDAPLKFLAISTREQPEICEYPDSNKYLAYTTASDGRYFDAVQRVKNNLDYWDGET